MRTLGIDLGTSGVRAVVLDEGAVVGSHGAAMPADRRRDPSSLWAAVQHVLAACDLAGAAAIAVAGTSGTLLAVSDAGAPLSQLSLYGDMAPPACADVIARLVPPGSAARGATSPLGRAIALQAVPGTRRILHEADWIAGMLCARFDTTDANNALKTGYDPLARRWPDWMAGTGMNMALLPHVITPGAALDRVTDSVSRQFGFPSDAIVAAGTTDGCASFLSTGAYAPGDAVTALGSTLTLKLLSHRSVSIPDYGIYSHSLGGHWLAGGASNTGGALLGACFTHADLDRLSARIDPHRDSGLDYYPLLRPGERFPINDPALPPRMSPRPADDAVFLQGLLEGIARIEALGYRRLTEHGAPPLTRVLSVGGGAGNQVWTQIRARILGVPVLEAVDASAARGAAILARGARQLPPI